MIDTTIDDLTALVTLEKFSEWLSKKNPEAFVGISANSCGCPLSMFIKKEWVTKLQNEQIQVFVNPFFITVHEPFKTIQMITPKWAGQFIQAIDGNFVSVHTSGRRYPHRVEASVAREVLSQVA